MYPESIWTCERKINSQSTEVHRRYQNDIHILGCIIGENIEDYWNLDGEKEMSDAWTRFTYFTLLNEKPPDGYTRSGGRLTRKQTTSRPDNVWPDMWKHMSDASKRKEKQKWATEKPKIDNARRLRGVYFIDPGDEEFKDFVKNALVKTPINGSGETCRSIGEKQNKTCLHCRS